MISPCLGRLSENIKMVQMSGARRNAKQRLNKFHGLARLVEHRTNTGSLKN